MAFIISAFGQPRTDEIAGAPSHQDPGYGLRGGMKSLEALLICI
jgi:hypothetical protein